MNAGGDYNLKVGGNMTVRVAGEFNQIVEGGSIHIDGEGTLITTEECLLNVNRNPHLTKEDIELKLKYYLGIQKIIWLPLGLAGDDDTDGHIDNFCCFVCPGHVLLSWTDDMEHAHYPRCQIAYEILSQTQDAQGRSLMITKIPIPSTMYYTEEDCQSLDGSCLRTVGNVLAGSYVNFYLTNNHGLVCPAFHVVEDSIAQEILQAVFPDRTIVPVYSKDILLGGGNIHCITQQQPVFPLLPSSSLS